MSYTAKKNKQSFPLRISSVNVNKFAVSCGFGQFTVEIINGRLHFLCNAEYVDS